MLPLGLAFTQFQPSLFLSLKVRNQRFHPRFMAGSERANGAIRPRSVADGWILQRRRMSKTSGRLSSTLPSLRSTLPEGG